MPFQKGNKFGHGRLKGSHNASWYLSKAGCDERFLAQKIKSEVEKGNPVALKIASEHVFGKPVEKSEVSMTLDVPQAIVFKEV